MSLIDTKILFLLLYVYVLTVKSSYAIQKARLSSGDAVTISALLDVIFTLFAKLIND